MTVLGRGDLSPRRRPRRRGRKVLVLLAVATLAVGGWFGWRAWRGDDNASVRTASHPCVQPSHPPAPLPAKDVHVRVLNATNRAGLAHAVAQQLRARGFRIAGVGNSPTRVAVTVVEHPASGVAAAEAVSEQLAQAQVQSAGVRVVTLVIGRDFRRLRSVRVAATANAADRRAASPTPSPCPSAAG